VDERPGRLRTRNHRPNATKRLWQRWPDDADAFLPMRRGSARFVGGFCASESGVDLSNFAIAGFRLIFKRFPLDLSGLRLFLSRFRLIQAACAQNNPAGVRNQNTFA
jgi:hypothetical protein